MANDGLAEIFGCCSVQSSTKLGTRPSSLTHCTTAKKKKNSVKKKCAILALPNCILTPCVTSVKPQYYWVQAEAGHEFCNAHRMVMHIMELSAWVSTVIDISSHFTVRTYHGKRQFLLIPMFVPLLLQVIYVKLYLPSLIKYVPSYQKQDTYITISPKIHSILAALPLIRCLSLYLQTAGREGGLIITSG